MDKHCPHSPSLIIEGFGSRICHTEREAFTNSLVQVLVKVFTNTTALRNSGILSNVRVASAHFRDKRESWPESSMSARQLAHPLPAPESKLYSLKLHGILSKMR